MGTQGPNIRRKPWLLRVIVSRPRLFLSAALCIVISVALATTTPWRAATCLLVGWDAAAAVYLALVTEIMLHSNVNDIRRRAAREDEGEFSILILTNAAALASLAAIVAELGAPTATGGRQPAHLPLAVLTILLSWALIHTIMALHYAHEFYDERRGGGLAFPGNDHQPDYWDFIYFSFCIGMTSQVSDVNVTRKHVRRTVAAHATVSFVFNTALLALAINIAASAI